MWGPIGKGADGVIVIITLVPGYRYQWYISVKDADVCICIYVTFVPGYRCPVVSRHQTVPVKFKFYRYLPIKFKLPTGNIHRPVINFKFAVPFFFVVPKTNSNMFLYQGTDIQYDITNQWNKIQSTLVLQVPFSTGDIGFVPGTGAGFRRCL